MLQELKVQFKGHKVGQCLQDLQVLREHRVLPKVLQVALVHKDSKVLLELKV